MSASVTSNSNRYFAGTWQFYREQSKASTEAPQTADPLGQDFLTEFGDLPSIEIPPDLSGLSEITEHTSGEAGGAERQVLAEFSVYCTDNVPSIEANNRKDIDWLTLSGSNGSAGSISEIQTQPEEYAGLAEWGRVCLQLHFRNQAFVETVTSNVWNPKFPRQFKHKAVPDGLRGDRDKDDPAKPLQDNIIEALMIAVGREGEKLKKTSSTDWQWRWTKKMVISVYILRSWIPSEQNGTLTDLTTDREAQEFLGLLRSLYDHVIQFEPPVPLRLATLPSADDFDE